MHQTSTPKTSSSDSRKRSSRAQQGPRESTLQFIRQFARSCRALPCSSSQLALVNLN